MAKMRDIHWVSINGQQVYLGNDRNEACKKIAEGDPKTGGTNYAHIYIHSNNDGQVVYLEGASDVIANGRVIKRRECGGMEGVVEGVHIPPEEFLDILRRVGIKATFEA